MVAEKGNTVFVHYVGTLKDGTQFDSSYEREPLEFVLGQGMLIPGFEAAVTGKEVGDKVETIIPAEEAYGEHNPDLVGEVPLSQVPESIEPEIGMVLQISTEGGPLDVTITEVDEEKIVIDGNHPLAGRELTFAIEIVEIKA